MYNERRYVWKWARDIAPRLYSKSVGGAWSKYETLLANIQRYNTTLYAKYLLNAVALLRLLNIFLLFNNDLAEFS